MSRAPALRPAVLTIAGSDPSGGAGIQADLKTFSALNVYGCAVLSALTAQSTLRVREARGVEPEFVALQLREVLTDLDITAAKTGMLWSREIIHAIAAELQNSEHAPKALVLDPVMVAKGGEPLLKPEAIDALRSELLPLATVITPNVPEAALLLGIDAEELLQSPRDGVRELQRLSGSAVYLKGGHAAGETVEDLFFDGLNLRELQAPRVLTKNTHGTGCTLSAAITAFLARGELLATAVTSAHRYVQGAIRGGVSLGLGHGHGPLDHLWEQDPL